ncbi:MAG TPA: DUF5995 family protein [Solirubrobacteraceae bacterium]|jgi:hypothetical protein|nr:DUF5995 family protein [Solirubrobacteraceae bacterium]
MTGPTTLPATTRTVADVVADMKTLGATMAADHGEADGVVRFNSLYLQVTEGVYAALAVQQDFFALPEPMHRLDVIFGQLYLDAVADLAAKRHVPHSWNALFRVRDKHGIASLQFVLGGMNAHINHDLSCALVSQWQEAGHRPSRDSPDYHDFTKVNEILKSKLDAEKKLLETGIIKDIDRYNAKVDDRVAMLGIEVSRERAWTKAELLWEIREMKQATRAGLSLLDHEVAALGHLILRPVV